MFPYRFATTTLTPLLKKIKGGVVVSCVRGSEVGTIGQHSGILFPVSFSEKLSENSAHKCPVPTSEAPSFLLALTFAPMLALTQQWSASSTARLTFIFCRFRRENVQHECVVPTNRARTKRPAHQRHGWDESRVRQDGRAVRGYRGYRPARRLARGCDIPDGRAVHMHYDEPVPSST
jgi:hypothetical protein